MTSTKTTIALNLREELFLYAVVETDLLNLNSTTLMNFAHSVIIPSITSTVNVNPLLSTSPPATPRQSLENSSKNDMQYSPPHVHAQPSGSMLRFTSWLTACSSIVASEHVARLLFETYLLTHPHSSSNPSSPHSHSSSSPNHGASTPLSAASLSSSLRSSHLAQKLLFAVDFHTFFMYLLLQQFSQTKNPPSSQVSTTSEASCNVLSTRRYAFLSAHLLSFLLFSLDIDKLASITPTMLQSCIAQSSEINSVATVNQLPKAILDLPVTHTEIDRLSYLFHVDTSVDSGNIHNAATTTTSHPCFSSIFPFFNSNTPSVTLKTIFEYLLNALYSTSTPSVLARSSGKQPYHIQSHNDERLVFDSSTITTDDLVISGIQSSHIFINKLSRHIRIQDVNESILQVGVSSGLLQVQYCHNVTIIAAVRSIHITDSSHVRVYLFTATRPVIMNGCEHITLAPYHTYYPSLLQHCHFADLNPTSSNMWSAPIVITSNAGIIGSHSPQLAGISISGASVTPLRLSGSSRANHLASPSVTSASINSHNHSTTFSNLAPSALYSNTSSPMSSPSPSPPPLSPKSPFRQNSISDLRESKRDRMLVRSTSDQQQARVTMMEDDDEMIVRSPEGEDDEKRSKFASPHIVRASSALLVNVNANYSVSSASTSSSSFAYLSSPESSTSLISMGHAKHENMDHTARNIALFGSTTPSTLSPSASFVPPHSSSSSTSNLHMVSLLPPDLFFSVPPPSDVLEDEAFLAKINFEGERYDTQQRREKHFLPVVCSCNPFTLPSTYQDMLEDRKLRAIRNRRMLDEAEMSPSQRLIVQQRIHVKFQHWLEESFPSYVISNMLRTATAGAGSVGKDSKDN